MSYIETINQKFAIAGWEEYKKRRYGLKSCKKTTMAKDLFDIRSIYMNLYERNECEETISCVCTLEKLEELINTI